MAEARVGACCLLMLDLKEVEIYSEGSGWLAGPGGWGWILGGGGAQGI